MPVNKNGFTKEIIAKAMQCKTAEDLMALAKAEGAEITKAEAEAYLAELADIELDEKALKPKPKQKPIWRNLPTLSWTKKR